MLLECQNCGAPLDAKPDARIVKCRYCGSSNTVDAMRKIAHEAPEDWRPPKVWVPPQHFPAPSEPHRFRGGVNPVGVFVALGVLVAAVGGGIAVVASSGGASKHAARPAKPRTKVQSWMDHMSTALQCGSNDKLVIDPDTTRAASITWGDNMRDKMMIDASGNCQLTIKGIKLKAEDGTIVQASGHSRIDIEDAKLQASGTVIDGSMSGVQVRIDGSKLKSDETAIQLGKGSKLYIDRSSIDAHQSAIETGQGSRVEVRSSSVAGLERSIETGRASTLVLRGARLTGKRELGPKSTVDER